jgi:hypothetical protein
MCILKGGLQLKKIFNISSLNLCVFEKFSQIDENQGKTELWEDYVCNFGSLIDLALRCGSDYLEFDKLVPTLFEHRDIEVFRSK